MSFYCHEPIFCPDCTAEKGKGPFDWKWAELTCITHNYSGCSVDIGECPQCRKQFQVSYKVDEIHRLV